MAFSLIPGLLVATLIRPAGPDITAKYSDQATELTTGVYLSVNPTRRGAAVDGPYFERARFAMRPFTLSVGGIDTGTLTLLAETVYGSGELIEVYDESGNAIALPAHFRFDQVPPVILVNALDTGSVVLTLRYDGGPNAQVTPSTSLDEVLIRIGPFPGLAGNPLARYPYFEYPRAINYNSSVSTALDPNRHAERRGLAYRAYVVHHKTPLQWAADPSLTDVTGGYETATVNGTTIQENTLLTWSGMTAADAAGGDRLGVAYDVVYDFGQDGNLDPGDLVDGFGETEEGFRLMPDTAVKGPHQTASFEFDNSGLFYTEGFDGGSTRSMRSRGLVVYPDPLPPGKLPLVTFSHGNTGVSDSYKGYLYLQELLASYGFITASFDMFPAHVSLGIRWRGWLSNKNTERLILQTLLKDHNGNPYPPMGGGIIDNKVDPKRIITSGHSRGGEGVIIEYNQVAHPDISGIRPPNGTLEGYDKDGFIGIHSIAEVTFLTVAQGSKTDDRNFLLYYGSSDNDVCGCDASVLPTIHYNRAYGNKFMSYLYGAGHGYYNQKWSCVCTGPFTMTRPEVEACSLSYLLPFAMFCTYGDVAATDFFTRSPNAFRPIGTQFITDEKVLVNLCRDAEAKGNFVIDDYETNSDPYLSSSGQPVSFDVLEYFENFFYDTNPAGGWSSTEKDGGFWWETDGSIFNWNGPAFTYAQTVAPPERDLSDDAYLSFITCQQADHPDTKGTPGDRDFIVTLVDGNGHKSSISTASYGGIDEPYLRSSGWGSAFKTYRLRLADFEANASGIDLKNVAEIRFEYGSNNGTIQGRLGFDDIEIVRK
ncbi:MAG: hypothetical protein U1E76_00265 [Planctomycetota bacterium]